MHNPRNQFWLRLSFTRSDNRKKFKENPMKFLSFTTTRKFFHLSLNERLKNDWENPSEITCLISRGIAWFFVCRNSLSFWWRRERLEMSKILALFHSRACPVPEISFQCYCWERILSCEFESYRNLRDENDLSRISAVGWMNVLRSCSCCCCSFLTWITFHDEWEHTWNSTQSFGAFVEVT